MRRLPNLLTALRLALSLFVFFALVAAGGPIPGWHPSDHGRQALELGAFVAFVVAAVTDFFDGWLARRYAAVTIAGAILDPIADKVLICAAIVGLIAQGFSGVAIPGALILFREFAVSALREVTAARGVKLPVTLLAKWKTTLQLVALAAGIAVRWSTIARPDDEGLRLYGTLAFDVLIWLACLVTLITGAQYAAQAWRALSDREAQ